MIYASGLHLTSPERWADVARTFGALLVDDAATYSPDQFADAVVADVVAAELASTNYERAVVGSRTATWDGTGWVLQCAGLTFGDPASGDDAAGLIVFEVVTDDSDSPVVGYIEFTAPEATDGSTFTVTPSTDGLLRVS